MGVFLGTSPISVLFAVVAFALVLYKWRYVSLASIVAAALIPFIVWLVGCSPEMVLMSLAIAALVIFRHRENISRLRAGTENKFKA